jgi:hypothetical protein
MKIKQLWLFLQEAAEARLDVTCFLPYILDHRLTDGATFSVLRTEDNLSPGDSEYFFLQASQRIECWEGTQILSAVEG